jgi:hypothetical protein
MANVLQWIARKATEIQKKHPRMKRASAVKEASKLWNKQKKKVVKKKPAKKAGRKVGAYKVIEKGEKKGARVTRTYQQVRSKSGEFKGMKSVGSISGHLGAAKRLLLDKIGKQEGRFLMATRKTDKTSIRKDINALKKQLRKLN